MKKIIEKYQFAVVGGGVAGTVAAIAAARLGLKTVLIQDRPVLGGPSSTECCTESNGEFITGAPEYVNRGAVEGGILDEMRKEAFYRTSKGWRQHWSMILREWVEKEKNLTLHLNTSVYDVECENNKIISLTAQNLNCEIQYIVYAPWFADCSGDSFVGFHAGAKYRQGRESKDEFNESLAPLKSDSKTMGSSIAFRAVDVGHPIEFVPPKWAYHINSDEDLP